MRREEFKDWLNFNGSSEVNGDSVTSYLSYLDKVEEGLQINLDTYLPERTEELIFEMKINVNFSHHVPKTLQNYSSAIRKYSHFLTP